jgi:hypothetical protein
VTGSGRKAVRRILHPGVLIWISLAAFTLALLGTSALGMGPDEPVNYVKAAAAARGQLDGSRVTAADTRRHYPYARPTSRRRSELERARLITRSSLYNSRFFHLPRSVAVNLLFPCFAQRRAIPASCGNVVDAPVRNPGHIYNYIGGYPPAPYAVAGLGSLLPTRLSLRWYATRLVGAFVALALVACSVVLLLEATTRRAWRVAALALAAVPTSLFVFAVVNAAGWEIGGGLVVAAAVLRLSRPSPPTARTWTLVAIGAGALAVSRPLGPLWLVPFSIVLFVLVGRQGIARLRRGGRAPKIAFAVVLLAALSTTMWVRVNAASAPIIWSRAPESLRLAVSDLWLVVLQLPAIFGWNDTPIAIPWYWFYGLGLVALCAVALVFGAARERIALILAIVFTIGAAIFIAAFPFEMYGQRYAMQARYILPFAVIIPLLAGELLARAAARAPREHSLEDPWYPTRGTLPAAVVAVMTIVQLVGWWTNAVRNANGFGGIRFWGGPWTPPLGWVPWTLLAAVGLASGMAAALAIVRAEPVGARRVGTQPLAFPTAPPRSAALRRDTSIR